MSDHRELTHHLALSLVPGIGPILQSRLLEQFGSAVECLQADSTHLRQVPGMGPQLIARLRNKQLLAQAEQEIARCSQARVGLLALCDNRYPALLREVPDPPQVMWYRGQHEVLNQLCVAIVGTRSPTPYGRRMAASLASGLALRGVTVVSGLARGIDGAAHSAAIAAQGTTAAVLATGVERIYPPEHHDLAQQIAAHGVVLSEVLGDVPRSSRRITQASRGAFPRRNRVISGLCAAVVVVEAPLKSGALITARHGLEQGREVMAVPGPADQPASAGCHALVRDGATLVTSAAEVLEPLGPLAQPVTTPAGAHVRLPRELDLSPQETQVLQAVGDDVRLVDEVICQTGLPPGRVLATLSVLERRQLVRRLGGSRVART